MMATNAGHEAALPHGVLEEVLPDIFFVTGTRHWDFMDRRWQFSRNMTVVRDGGALTLFNAVRLSDEGLAALDALGRVAHVVQLGGLHGVDDAFYRDRYGATYWAQPGAGQAGVTVDAALTEDAALPLPDAELFVFRTTKVPECILRLGRDGGVLVACDALQNYLAPDRFFDDGTAALMDGMGFFRPANVGVAWMQAAAPGAEDFRRLAAWRFEHVLCAHGAPVVGGARPAFAATFEALFGI